MRVVVFGANGPSGRLLCEQALHEGHTVSAVTRHPEQFPLAHERVTASAGNAYGLESVAHAVAGHDAVVSTLGVPYSEPVEVRRRASVNRDRPRIRLGDWRPYSEFAGVVAGSYSVRSVDSNGEHQP